MPGEYFHCQFVIAPPDVPGVFMRAEESSEKTSCKGAIAIFEPDRHANSMNSQAK